MGGRESSPTLLVGPRSARHITGVSLAFELAASGFEARNLPYRVVDIVFLGFAAATHPLARPLRGLETLLVILHAWMRLPFCSRVYMTMSTSNGGFIRDFAIVRLASMLRKPVYLHLHGAGFRPFYTSCSPRLQRLIVGTLGKVRRIIVLGESIKEQFQAAGVAEEKVVVIPNGLPEGVPEPHGGVKSFSLKADEPFQILFMSSMMPSKGYDELLQACHMLLARDDFDFECHFCGKFLRTNEDRTSLTAEQLEQQFLGRIKELGVSRHVQWHGQVAGDRKLERLRQCHVLALPTWHPWEGQPLCIVEAMAFATPVITSNYNDLPDLVPHQTAGLLIDKNQPKQLAQAIQQLATNPDDYARMSKQARMRYEQRYTRDAFVRRLLNTVVEEPPP